MSAPILVFDELRSKDDIYSILLAGHLTDSPPAQIQVLFRKGYKEAAIELFASKFAQSKFNEHYRANLKALAIKLELPKALWASG